MSLFQRGELQAARRRIFLCACALVVFYGLFSASANAQTAPQPKANPPVSQTFADYFTQVATQNHIVIVAESIPLRLTITDEEKQTLIISVRSLPLQKSIAAQAAFFDYESQFIPPNRFVLRKKYTSPADLPYVSLDEAAHFLDAAERIIRRYKSPFEKSYQFDPSSIQAARSFTPTQLDLMKDGKLPMASLSPDQRDHLRNVMTCFYIDNGVLGLFPLTQNKLRSVRMESEGRFHRYARRAESPFPIYAPFVFLHPTPKLYNKTGQIPLSFMEGHHLTSQGDTLPEPERDADGNKIPYQDASEPNETDVKAAEAQTRALVSPTVTTFGRLAERLTERGVGKTVYVVEAELKTNPVSLFGAAEKENGEALWAACASAYDLRVVEEKGTEETGMKGKRVLSLTRPIVNPPGRLEDLPRAVSRLMPGPLVRGLHLPEMNAAFAIADAVTARTQRAVDDRALRRSRGETVPEPVVTDAERERGQKDREKNDAAWENWVSAPDGMEKAALRRLRATAEAKANAAPEGKAPLSALDDIEKNALTLALIYTSLDSFQNFCLAHPPVYVERFNELTVYGKPYFQGEEKIPCLEIQLGFLQTSGNFRAKMGFVLYLDDPAPYWQRTTAEEAARKKQAGY